MLGRNSKSLSGRTDMEDLRLITFHDLIKSCGKFVAQSYMSYKIAGSYGAGLVSALGRASPLLTFDYAYRAKQRF